MGAAAGIESPAEPLPSATVALARDGGGGPELLLMLRHARTSFGATYVFPGGLLHADDDAVADRCDGVDAAAANRALGLTTGGLAYYSAAIRELFEEAGVLLARSADGAWADAGALTLERDALNDGSLQWSAFLEHHDLRLAGDALHYFSWWITPREISKRFSTRFFMAALPAGQVASHCGTELTDSRWLPAAAALDEHRRGTIELPHPTFRTLADISPFPTTAALLEWAAERTSSGVDCLLPAVVEMDGETRVLMPGDPDYPDYDAGGDAA